MHDFTLRTRALLGSILVENLIADEEEALGVWNDVVGRCGMAGLVVGCGEGRNGKGGDRVGKGGKGGFGKGEGKKEGIFAFDFGEEVRRIVGEARRVAGGAGRGVVLEGEGEGGGKGRGNGGGRKRKR
jgi:hypothetical protein